MSLEANRMRRLVDAHQGMTRLLGCEDFAGGAIAEYRELLFRSLEALDAGIADQIIGSLRLVYGYGGSPAGGPDNA